MRAMDITMFVFIFNIALGMTNGIMTMTYSGVSLNKTEISYNISKQQLTSSGFVNKYLDLANTTASAMNAQENILTAAFSWFNVIWKGFILIVTGMIDFFIGIVSNVYILSSRMGVPDIISIPLQLIVSFVSVVGLMQIIGKFSFREQQ